jgi:hypothetical protein
VQRGVLYMGAWMAAAAAVVMGFVQVSGHRTHCCVLVGWTP